LIPKKTFGIFDLFGKIVRRTVVAVTGPDSGHDKEELILAAARKRFAYYGFSKATMDEIAADVGMAKPSLYYYYSTKEELFNTVVAREQEHFFRDIEHILTKPIPESMKLKEFVGTRLRLFRQFVNLSHLGLDSWAEVTSASSELYKRLEHRELRFLHAILDTGKTTGEFTVANPRETAQLLLHALHGLRVRALQSSSVPMLGENTYTELRKEMDLLIDHLINGIRTHS
jgi:TetR/AcrR family transcriptional regulator